MREIQCKLRARLNVQRNQCGLELFRAELTSPEEHLACDEALLEYCEQHGQPGFLRFWESHVPFVVLGYGKHLDKEVFRDNCTASGIPILRRCSGGGTVLQGPGSLNYALVLPIGRAPALESITGANRYIMERNRSVLEVVSGLPVSVEGYTDLAVQRRKFSGNAQRRKRSHLLFHGTFLLNFDLELIARILRPPVQQPEYRGHREHVDFLTNLPVRSERLKEEFCKVWGKFETPDVVSYSEIRRLTTELIESKYGRKDWNERF